MTDSLQDAFSGNIVRFWGRSPAVGTAFEDLNHYGLAIDPYLIMTTGFALDVVSSSTADASPSGTGARTIRIVGLDAAGAFQTAVVTLNGQTIVTTTTIWTDVWAADVITTGTGRANAGDIYIIKTGTGGVITAGVPATVTSGMLKILVGWNTDMNGHFCVPVGSPFKYKLVDICASAYTQSGLIQVGIQEPFSATDASIHVASVIGLGSSGHAQIDAERCDFIIGAGQALRLRALCASASGVVQATAVLKRVF
jgi:hypothetical protein